MRFLGFLLATIGLVSNAWSQTVIPHNFTEGTRARAAEVNANFAAVKKAIDDLSARVAKLEGPMSASDVAGEYQVSGLEMAVDGDSSSPSPYAVLGGVTRSGIATFTTSLVPNPTGGDFTFDLTAYSNEVRLEIAQAGAPPYKATLANPGVRNEEERDLVRGTWLLRGNVVELRFGTPGDISEINAYFVADGQMFVVSTHDDVSNGVLVGVRKKP